MTDLFLLTEAQMRRIEPFFPLSHGVPRVDDRRVISGIVFVIRNGLRWRDAPREYGPHKTAPAHEPIVDRLVRTVFARSIAPPQPVPDDEDDPANHPSVINSGNTMRQWEKRLDPAHLRLGEQEQFSHGDASLRRH